MPELPEVQTIVAQLALVLPDAKIASVVLSPAKVFHCGGDALPTALPGRRINRIWREGKRIVMDLSPAARLVVHLGMTGNLVAVRADAPIRKHTHLRVRFARRPIELRFVDPRKFGGIWFLDGSRTGSLDEVRQMPPGLRRLGPDALTITTPVLRGVLQRSRQIKALLLDQQAIAGLGNIYCDEALFVTGIHPLTLAANLNERQVRTLAGAIRKTLRASIAAGGTTISDYRDADGNTGRFQQRLRVYGLEGKPCPRCATPIQRISAAGRSSHVCPKCQRPPKSRSQAG